MNNAMLPLAVALAFATPIAHANDASDWQIKVGAHIVDPKSNNGSLAGGALKANVGSAVSTTITIEYLFNPNLGIEVLAAVPFQHDVKLNGVKAATVKQLPPTVSAQWHFRPGAKVIRSLA